MKKHTPATRVRENIVIGAMETKIATGQSVFILAAMDEYSRFAIAFEVVFVNSTELSSDKKYLLINKSQHIRSQLHFFSDAIPKMLS